MTTTYRPAREFGLLSRSDLARATGCTTPQISTWIANKVLPAPRHKHAGGKITYWKCEQLPELVRAILNRPLPVEIQTLNKRLTEALKEIGGEK